MQFKRIEADELPFEFMMNALRLNDGVAVECYAQRTGLNLDSLAETLDSLRSSKINGG